MNENKNTDKNYYTRTILACVENIENFLANEQTYAHSYQCLKRGIQRILVSYHKESITAEQAMDFIHELPCNPEDYTRTVSYDSYHSLESRLYRMDMENK